MSNSIVIGLGSMPLIKEAIKQAVNAVNQAGDEANVSPLGFQIDGAFCDWGEIETSGVAEVIDEAASQFSESMTDRYNDVVNYICEQVTSYFAKEETVLDIQDLICTGRANVAMEPVEKGENDYGVILKINNKYFGEFPTYTEASNHLEGLANG